MASTMEIMSETEMSSRLAEEEGAQAAVCPLCGGGPLSEMLVAPDRFHLRTEMYRLVRCSCCSGVTLASPPAPAEMGRHYTEDYHNAIVVAGEGSAAKRWKDQVKMIARYRTGGALLDIGCSSGGFLSTMVGPGWKLYGIEMEDSTAQRARSTTGAEVFVGDAVEAPFPAAK